MATVNSSYIRNYILPEFLDNFEAKLAEYGNMHTVLGIKAQFVDLHRKLGKLQRAWWEGVDTAEWREQPREIAMDMIGHLLLAISLLDANAGTDVNAFVTADDEAIGVVVENHWQTIQKAQATGLDPRCVESGCALGTHTFKHRCIYKNGVGTAGLDKAPAGNSGSH